MPEALLASAMIVADVSAATFVSWRISGRAAGEDGSSFLRMVVGLVVGLAQMIGVEMVCGALVVLYAPVVLAANVVIAGYVWHRVPAVERSSRIGVRRGPLTSALASLLGFVFLIDGRLSVRPALSEPDDLMYHLPNAASWIQIHDLWHLPASNPGFFTNGYPSDGELLTSWIMQPLHQAQWAALPVLLFGVAALAAAGLLAEELGGSPLLGVLAASTVVLCPISWLTQADSAMTDWASLSGLVASVAFTLHGRRKSEWRWPILAGLALGIGVGSKDTALVPALLVLGLLLAIYPRSSRVRAALLLVAGTVALSGVWFVRDALQTGNPFYPESVGFAGTTLLHGGVGPITKYSASVLKDVFTGNGTALRAWLHYLRTWVGLPLLVCAGAALTFTPPRRRSVLELVAVMTGAWFVIYLAAPYTGPSSVPLWIYAQIRYALPAMTLAAVCASAASRRLTLVVSWLALGTDLWTILRGIAGNTSRAPTVPMVLVAAGGAIFVGLVVRSPRRFSNYVALAGSHVTRGLVAGAVAVASCGALTLIAIRNAPTPSPLDRALAATGRSRGKVMIDGLTDVFYAVGNELQYTVVSAGGGGAAHQVLLDSPALLDARIRRVAPVALIVGTISIAGVTVSGAIPGWTPPGYRLLYTTYGTDVYVRD